MKEIERKFLLNKYPSELESYPMKEIEQYYVSLNPEVRLRRAGEQCFLTVKIGEGLVRQEIEAPISLADFEAMKEQALGNVVEKVRYYIQLDCGLLLELDKYKGELSSLGVVEIEFPSELEAKMFLPLSWFGKEVTTDKQYKNQSLALNGIPK